MESVLKETLPQTLDDRYSVPCPEGCKPRFPQSSLVANLVIHLNDDHRWSRNRIADWLDGLDIDLTFQVPSDL